MAYYNTIYNQMLQLVPRHEFDALVRHYQEDAYVKYFTAWQQFLVLLYAQIRHKESLRDIQTSLLTHQPLWYHIGLKNIRRSTLSDANTRRDPGVFEGLFYALLSRCKALTPQHPFKFKNPLYTLDSTVLDLCLSLFPWAKFRKTKGALKLHYLYDHSGAIPSFLVVTDAKPHDVHVAKELSLPLLPDSILVVDRAYVDFSWLFSLWEQGVFFVTRMKTNLQYDVTGQHPVSERDRKRGVLWDKEIGLKSPVTRKKYPEPLRLIGFRDPETQKTLVFITNQMTLSAYTVTQLYKARWQIELFFKWIKQHLRIKSFLGTSRHAVLTQIWVAMCYYLLLAYLKYQTKYRYSLLELTRVLDEILWRRVSLVDILSLNRYTISKIREPVTQLPLF